MEEYKGSLADAKVFTPSVSVTPQLEGNVELKPVVTPVVSLENIQPMVGTLNAAQTQYLNQLTQQSNMTDNMKVTQEYGSGHQSQPYGNTTPQPYNAGQAYVNSTTAGSQQYNSAPQQYGSSPATNTYNNPNYTAVNSNYGNTTDAPAVTQQQQPVRTNTQRARVSSPSKIPASAVEIPADLNSSITYNLNEISCTPPEIREVAHGAINKLLPKKSEDAYKKEYTKFENWCQEKNVKLISENILIAYFEKLSKTLKSSSLWSIYSMLRSCINVYKNVDIKKYAKLRAFLNRCSDGYEPKKSKILEFNHIDRFITTAENNQHLAMKVALIMRFCGACRRDELINMLVDDIVVKDDVVTVTVTKTKNKVRREFLITEKLWIKKGLTRNCVS